MNAADWDRLVEEIGPRLYRYFRYTGVAELAADLTQETFIRLVAAESRFDSERGPAIAFALGIAQNIWRETLRKAKPTEDLEAQYDLASGSDLQEDLEKLDESLKLRAIVSRLPRTQQDILYFYFDEEITTREISEILKIPEGTVKSHLHRAKETIGAILRKEWA